MNDEQKQRVRQALTFSVIVQVALVFLGGMILDCGITQYLVVVAAIFFWASVVGVASLRGYQEVERVTAFDIALLKYGYALILVLTMHPLNMLAFLAKEWLGIMGDA